MSPQPCIQLGVVVVVDMFDLKKYHVLSFTVIFTKYNTVFYEVIPVHVRIRYRYVSLDGPNTRANHNKVFFVW